MLIFNLWYRNKGGCKTIHTFTERIENKTNSYINERHNTTMDIETEQKSKNLGNITYIMVYYPRNVQVGDTEAALNTTY